LRDPLCEHTARMCREVLAAVIRVMGVLRTHI